MSLRYLYILGPCKHVILGFATVQGPVSCPECRRLRDIQAVHVHEWHAECRAPRCNFSRWTGVSQRLAEQQANAHAKSKQHDKIIVSYSPRPDAVKLQEKLERNALL